MIIAHISDLQVTAPGPLYQGRIDTAGMARAAVSAVNESEPPGFLLHHIQPCGTVVSHLQPIGGFGSALEFF